MHSVLNIKNNIVTFNQGDKNWIKKVEFNNYYYSPFFLKNCFKFKGTINVNQFIISLNETFKVYDVMLSSLKKDSDGNIFISLCGGESESLELEDKNDQSIVNGSLNDMIPLRLMNNAQKMGFDFQFNQNSKVALFKLTRFMDGFSIGFCISHAFFDVSSFVYFFKYLSQIYSNGKNNLNLVEPQLMDYSIFKSDQIELMDHNQAIIFANSRGIFFENEIDFNLFKDNSTMYLKFSISEIDNFKINHCNLSKNDIISAILLKIYTFSNKLNNNEIFNIRYPFNIRKKANIGENVIGNLFSYCHYSLKVSEIRSLSIIELANINRINVSSNTLQQFKDQVNWFEYIQKNTISTLSTLVPSFLKTNLTNWNQNSFDEIKFGNSTPFSLETESMASGGTNVISFNIDDENCKILTTSISIPKNCVDQVKQLGKNSKLYDSILI